MAKSNVVTFRRTRKSGDKIDRLSPQGKPRTGHGPHKSLMAVISAIVVGAAGWLAFGGASDLPALPAVAKTPVADSLSAAFSICGDGRHVNCVVDGDTFRFQGQKIRIEDIDTPELSPPRCEAERTKGEAAKARLLALLNDGKFSLSAVSRDEDKYGRKLRRVTRSGYSLGETLVGEGLARRWDGARHGWCG